MIYELRLLKNNYTKDYFIKDFLIFVFSSFIDIIITWGLLSLINGNIPFFHQVNHYQHDIIDSFSNLSPIFDFLLFFDSYIICIIIVLIVFIILPFLMLYWCIIEHLHKIETKLYKQLKKRSFE